jgi:hypothetical protein
MLSSRAATIVSRVWLSHSILREFFMEHNLGGTLIRSRCFDAKPLCGETIGDDGRGRASRAEYDLHLSGPEQ